MRLESLREIMKSAVSRQDRRNSKRVLSNTTLNSYRYTTFVGAYFVVPSHSLLLSCILLKKEKAGLQGLPCCECVSLPACLRCSF